ncbi:histidinol phosphate aminotransferase [Aquicoccus porphyridii]|uniref:Histidinol phosphate aminotransferase n=1 Tax=Aquicoccus porphyridii TaxID=1852029 RepID=A0A5A9YY61_9RHOB|nr:histidinol phosphate aminotransferase [Aquicoccus porphyridii]KAA0909784.1 histidinol phosphate aminotransferase [Aquicoccus porphyridii]RAI52859.1 histidinol phosphate aminotransferase [Rhodobacteraceae bacterium AsT-22]
MQNANRAAPDYSTPALVMALVNLLWSFMLIWASLGLPAVLVLAVLLNYLISRLGHHRTRRADDPTN